MLVGEAEGALVATLVLDPLAAGCGALVAVLGAVLYMSGPDSAYMFK